ncbi:MAG: restriction endonuclease [Meiothermus ruber]|uniref:restriction endonuclease n=1 Tax=Meiothermus ruber TaxID=277 RepID=UPI0023F7A7F0|nr:restriction endonuclease [Meiothermus ruber]MCL6531524.1 restriction endonuclease [Meiothermus ruber]
MPRSDLPFGSEFSPDQVDLPTLLELAEKHRGDISAFEEAIRKQYFERNDTSEENKKKLANNTRLSMIAYGLIERDVSLTEFGKGLYLLRDNLDEFYKQFAQHILLKLKGMSLVQCVLDLEMAGETFTRRKLKRWLNERGIYVPPNGRHDSTMKLWLEKAGVFKDWRVNQDRLAEVAGISIQKFDALATLTKPQRDFLKALANVGGGGPYAWTEITRMAEELYGTEFTEGNVPKTVLYPLERAGYITLQRGTKAPGRGAKPFLVCTTPAFDQSILEPLLEQVESQVNPDLRPLLRQPLANILEKLNSDDRHIAGLALEALAFKLMRLLDLDYVSTRLRGDETGGAEVDLIFQSSRLVFSRWQVQCKNTGRVRLDDVAKEVGLANFLKSNVIVIITTGEISSEARRFATKTMQDTNLCIVVIDGADIKAIRDDPYAIIPVMEREAKTAMRLKTLPHNG